MILQRYIGTASVICSLTLVSGSALAADVSFDTTGPGSTQKVEINNSSDVVVSNTNVVQVTNENVQSATTGDVEAAKNTSVEGGLVSGDASNSNTTATAVSVNNEAAVVPPAGGNGGENGGNNGGTGSSNGGSGSSTGEVLGASTGGMGGGTEMLPEVGASIPMDVSALRAAWQPQQAAPTANLAKGSQWLTTAMLLTATLLGMLGAIGSAWYARRQERV